MNTLCVSLDLVKPYKLFSAVYFIAKLLHLFLIHDTPGL